jgi:hypothetical protein
VDGTVVVAGTVVVTVLVVGGGGVETTKSSVLVAVPPGVPTAILPVVAPVGTVAVICVGETTVNAAAVPANVTDVAPVKFVPAIVTTVPGAPDEGPNAEMVGAGGGGGAVAIIHGAGAVVSPARNSNVPRSAGVMPSQCCSNVTPNDVSVPFAA